MGVDLAARGRGLCWVRDRLGAGTCLGGAWSEVGGALSGRGLG